MPAPGDAEPTTGYFAKIEPLTDAEAAQLETAFSPLLVGRLAITIRDKNKRIAELEAQLAHAS